MAADTRGTGTSKWKDHALLESTFPTSVVLKVWTPDLQHKPHLVNSQKCTFLDHDPLNWKLPGETCNLWLIKASTWFSYTASAAAKSLQSCPTLCDPIDGSPPGSPLPGILQARILEWVAISFSNAWKWKVKSLSCVWLLATPWTAAYQAPPSMGFSSQEYWSGVPLKSFLVIV